MSVRFSIVFVKASTMLVMHRQVRVRRRPLNHKEYGGQDVKQNDSEV